VKTTLWTVFAVVAGFLGLVIAYSQTGLPERPGPAGKAITAGYGKGTQVSGVPANWSMADANPRLLVRPLDIETNSRKWTIVDCRDKASYDEGHIPGAISLGGRCHTVIRDTGKIIPVVGKMESDYDPEPIKKALEEGRLDRKTLLASLSLRPVEDLERLFAGAGISHDRTVVLYSDARDTLPGYHAVPFFTLEYLGHPDVRVLDGGIEEWKAYRKPLETREHTRPPSGFKARVVERRLATTGEVLKIAKGELKDVQLVDSRLPVEFSGERASPPGHFLEKAVDRAGRIPNTTLNVPHFQQFQDTETLRLKKIAALAAMYQGLDKNKRTVLYCYIANRISFGYFVLRLLGFKDPAIYHDSWIVWGNDTRLPVERDGVKKEAAAGGS
jgi:thiosulfate/3-mercaptopyruvate sulfurtransferase